MTMSLAGIPITVKQFVYIMMICMLLSMVLSLIGLCGTWRDSKVCLCGYCLCLFILIALLLTASIMVFVFLNSFGGMVQTSIRGLCNPRTVGAVKADLCG